MTTVIVIVGGTILIGGIAIGLIAGLYRMGYQRGRHDGRAHLTTLINECKVEFTYVDIVPRKTPRL
jgi:hypothetical protein